ncbi:uncharacterized protein LOC131333760 [Rhododendron vialii]|uniref:uncharacterized protein LOC131333760 n=1 Tax=Rhododendron vialii TaxID=182163 RepID=UPI00265EE648|nr:uncharacterized protein LOC131333760 [Rhododendron vialii]
MVLWEITLGTAYFLGLKRTYRLALKIQRRLITPNHPKIRQFVHGRTRAVFDVAVQVHQNIQQRDIEVGRSLGNWILRWLDQIKPSAQISVPPMGKRFSNTSNMTKHLTYSSLQKTPGRFQRFSPRNIWPKPFPTIATIMRPGTSIQYKRLSHRRGAFEGVIRKDIMQWMLQN